MAVKTVSFEDRVESLLKIRGKNVYAGKIDGDGDDPFVFISPQSDPACRLVKNVLVERADLTVLLEKRYEVVRRYQTELGMTPAHQRFRSG